MQHSPHEIKEKLLKALDKDYNVLDMPVVVEIVGILEQIPITKEALETTRLGKYINELRRKTNNDLLAKRAKELVRKWRDLILPQTNSNGGDSSNVSSRQSTNKIISPACNKTLTTWNDSRQISPALNTIKSNPSSPSSRLSSLSPGKQRTSRPSSPLRPQCPILKKVRPVEVQGVILPSTVSDEEEQPRTQPVVHRGRGRPPLDRTKTPPRPRGRPPSSEHQPTRGRGRPPLDPEKRAARGRGRGRPPKNKNKLKKELLEMEENNEDELVPKTSPANKRLRKTSDEEGESQEASVKKQKINGVLPDVPINSEEVKIPKKRGRKKGSKNAPKILPLDRDLDDDLVKMKMASVVRNPKVKTTRELLECIQKESSLDNLRTKTLTSLGVSDEEDMNKSKTEHIHKFLRSQMDDIDYEPLTDNNHYNVDTKYNNKHVFEENESVSPVRIFNSIKSPPTSPPLPPPAATRAADEDEEVIDVEKLENENETVVNDKIETVSEILAKLPPINSDDIIWSDTEGSLCDGAVESEEKVISENDLERLNNEHIECVNGNWNDGELVPGLNHGLVSLLPAEPNVKHDDNFREWQECVSKQTYNGNLLHILPYVIID